MVTLKLQVLRQRKCHKAREPLEGSPFHGVTDMGLEKEARKTPGVKEQYEPCEAPGVESSFRQHKTG